MSNETFAFRSALGGFHRGDVSKYISETAAAHQAQTERLQEQIAALEQENETLRAQLEALQEPPMEKAEEPAMIEAAEEPPVEELAPEEPEESLRDRELAAYRRAEAAERLANLRARKVYADLQTVCDESTREFDGLSDTAQAAADNIGAQLDIIRSAVENVCAAMQTSSEKLSAISQLVPDPAETLTED
ncbi:MAG: hypothetical protein IJ206_10185 [Oscillospiraceae bacterium]|nr:hypothetical protein [Oscillospiraceae bacterium]